MYSEDEITELLSLLKQTREQLAYFKELGVQSIESGFPSNRPMETTVREAAAPLAEAHHQQATSTTTAAAGVARKSYARNETSPPPPDALFADLTAPPVRIQKSSESFEEIWADIGDCTRCPLHQE